MANKPSVCASDAIFEGVVVLPKAAQDLAKTYINQNLSSKLSAKGIELINRIEAIGVTAVEVGKSIQKAAKKTEKFESMGRIAATDKGTKMGNREVILEDLVSHFTLSPAYFRIAAQVRGFIGQTTGKSAVKDFVARISASEAAIRSSGIPIVINKVAAAAARGPMHYSFLAMGDIGRVFIKTDFGDTFGTSVLRSSDPTKNIQFVNLAEAARRVIEESATNPEGLEASIRQALTTPAGAPTGIAKTATESAMAWTRTAEGTKVVDELVSVMTDPKFIKELAFENDKLTSITVALARADGYKLASDTLSTVADLTKQGAKLKGYGKLFLDNGIVELFSKDSLVNLTPDKLNLAFAQQAIALFFSHLDDASLSAIVASSRKSRGAAKDAATKKKTGKPTKKGLNKANKANGDDIAEASAKQVADEIENDVTIRNMESSIEASSIARQYYLENYYGSIVGGLTKAISKVSNLATMGSAMKTSLIGVENIRLETPAIMTADLRKFADRHGQNIPKFNEIFKRLQDTTDETRQSVIAGLTDADQTIANEMLFYIDRIYGDSDLNKLVEEGIYASEMINSLKLVGQPKQAAFFESRSVTEASEAKDFWKELELQNDENIVEILSKYYHAINISMIKPNLAQGAARNFSHEADGLSRADAIAQGYRPIKAEGGLSDFLGTGDELPLFHPEVVKQLEALNYYLEFTKGFKNEGIQKLVDKVDTVVGVLKSSVTIWRPGHHATSVMGNAVANTLAGVLPRHYITAVKIMKQHGMIDELDVNALDEIAKINIPEGYVFTGAAEGVKIALKDAKTGKIKTYTLDYDGIARGLSAIAGVRISPRRVKDVVESETKQSTAVNALMQNPAAKSITAVDHQLARASAARDNVFRYALAVKELEKGTHNTLEQAFQAAGAKVHEFHPTVGTLTAEERKYARRLFYFYTWQKQAFFKILDLTANSPAIITVPSKLQFAIAESQGLNPESFGQPYDPTQLFAAYNTNSVYGPQFNTEFGPAGIKPAITQLDVMDSYLSQFQTKPGLGLWENIGYSVGTGATGIFGKNVTPLLRIPAELATGNKIGDVGKITDIPQYLLDQTGASSISRVTGQTPWGPRSDLKTGEYAEANRERQMINYWLGAKFTYYQSPAALETARKERLEYFKRINNNGE